MAQGTRCGSWQVVEAVYLENNLVSAKRVACSMPILEQVWARLNAATEGLAHRQGDFRSTIRIKGTPTAVSLSSALRRSSRRDTKHNDRKSGTRRQRGHDPWYGLNKHYCRWFRRQWKDPWVQWADKLCAKASHHHSKSQLSRNNDIAMLTGSVDISRMCKCRFAGVDGPDYAGHQFIHHRKCFGVNSPGFVDSKRIFHVSIICIGAGLC